MARISAKIGDEIFVEDEGRMYEIRRENDGGEITLTRSGLCASCHRNTGDDFQTQFGNLCGVCINTAMETYIAHLAIEHLMNNDDQIVEVLHVMERYDADNAKGNVPHIDFHSSAIDYAWGMTEDDMSQFGMSLSASIRSVIESRTLLNRA